MSGYLSSVLQLSESEKQYLIDGCADDCRIDGRTREEFRHYAIVTSSSSSSKSTGSGDDSGEEEEENPPPLILSNGSARLFLSSSSATTSASTHVLCSIRAELGRPSEQFPTQGTVQIHVEDTTTPSSSSLSRKKSQEERNNLQSIITELLSNNLIDLEALCIIPHHYAFTVHIDVEILCGTAGTLVDACCHTIRAAVQNTLLPHIIPSSTAAPDDDDNATTTTRQAAAAATTDLILESDIRHAKVPVGIDKAPYVVTVTICKRRTGGAESSDSSYLLLLDASLEEEACSYCQVHVAVDPPTTTAAAAEPTICALRKTGSGSLPWALLPDITALAFKGIPKAMESYRVASSTTSSVLQQNNELLQQQIAIQ